MSKDYTLAVFVNPLMFIDAEEAFNPGQQPDPSFEAIVKYLSQSENKAPTKEELLANYKKVAQNVSKLYAVPAEVQILTKIVFPLKSAVGYYMLGNFIESIAISAMVAEMCAIFRFQIFRVTVNNRPIIYDEDEAKQLKKFEKMRQFDRTTSLLKFGLIDQKTKDRFDFVAQKRNQYVHKLSMDNQGIEVVAKEVFEAALEILLAITGLGVGNGKAVLDTRVLEYLKRKGFIQV